MVTDRLTDEVRQESTWTMKSADGFVICSESREQLEDNVERWRYVLVRRGMNVSRSEITESRDGKDTRVPGGQLLRAIGVW